MKLYFVNGDRNGTFWDLVPPGICIGREEDNDIQLLLPGISRYHAKVEYNGREWCIADLGSTNGTKINGKKITGETVLRDGMQITLGDQVIRFVGQESTVKDTTEKGQKKTPETVVLQAPSLNPAEDKVSVASKQEGKKEETTPPEKEKKLQKLINPEDLFRKKTDVSSSSGKEGENPALSPGKRIHNLLVVLLVVVLGCAALMVFVMLNTPAKKQTAVKVSAVRNPFILEYEKKIIQADNVFRFYVRVEDHSALFKLNDLRHGRHFTRGIGQVEKELLQTLLREVKDTDFMKITSAHPGKPREGVDDYRKLTVGYGSNLNTVICHNTDPQRSFEAIENALESFADGFGLKTISLSEEQMRKEADQSFEKAEELFRNYQARPENLRNAIARYQITVDFLEQFEPKPQNWIMAKRKLLEANKLLNKLKKDAQFNIEVLYKKKQYAEAAAVCNNLLLYLDPEEPAYQKTRQYKLVFERLLSLQKKKRTRR